ncbi:MAG TPA: glycosidase, partial [Caldithrix abyssi]|nr:glycosidase [Caldithrix abyssi]
MKTGEEFSTMIVERSERNPILTTKDVPFKANSLFNAGAIKFNNQYLLICRVEMPNGISALVKAWSKDGIQFKVEDKFFLTAEDHHQFYEYVQWGIEDVRINPLNGEYYLTYTGYSPNEPVVLLARTTDFEKVEILGTISEPVNKDAVLFPEKINGYYW